MVLRDAHVDPDEILRERRYLHASATFMGMVRVDGLLDPETGGSLLTAIGSVLDADARSGVVDERTPAQRLADALGEVCRGWLDRPDRHTVAGERPHLNVVVAQRSRTPGTSCMSPRCASGWTRVGRRRSRPVPTAGARRATARRVLPILEAAELLDVVDRETMVRRGVRVLPAPAHTPGDLLRPTTRPGSRRTRRRRVPHRDVGCTSEQRNARSG